MHSKRAFLAAFSVALSVAPVANAQDCPLCAKKVVVSPATAPCLQAVLQQAAGKAGNFVTFDLAQCSHSSSGRGVVPGLPDVESPTARPTIRFVLQRSKLGCLNERFVAVQERLNPFAILDMSTCP